MGPTLIIKTHWRPEFLCTFTHFFERFPLTITSVFCTLEATSKSLDNWIPTNKPVSQKD